MLDPQAQALLDSLAAQGVAPVHTLSPMAAREAYRRRRVLTQAPGPSVAQQLDLSPATNGRPLPMRLYRPLGWVQDSPGPALPALLYFHGGGWTVGDLESHDGVCRHLCNASGGVVVAVDYRLGPEHRFPAAYEDALAAFAWLVAQAASLGVDPHRVAVGGDSAGANLAAALCLGQRGTPEVPTFQLLIYPSTQMLTDTPSYHANGQGYMLTKASMAWYMNNYLAQPADVQDWRASPLLAPSLAGLPPALVLTAGYDPLRDEGRLYADALSRAGVAAQYLCFERQIHGFITMTAAITEALTALDVCAAALRRRWSQA